MKTAEVLEKVLKGKRVKPETQRHYIGALGSLARFSEEWPTSGEVIDEWLVSLGGYADMTVRVMFNFVNSAGKYVQKISGRKANGAYRVINPCEGATKPTVTKKRRRIFNGAQLVMIIRACRFEQDKVLILTLMDSLARVGELVGLRAKDVGNGWIDVIGKTGERRYRLDVAICAKLRELGADGEPIFRGRFGGEANVNSLKHRVRRVIKEAGITGSKLGPHTLRHSGASLVAKATGSALTVKALLQHDKIETSMEYIHEVEDGDLQQGISPLRLVSDSVFGFGSREFKQIGMGADSEALGVPDGEVVQPDMVVDMLEEQFPEIADGVTVRPLLKTADLRLIRGCFLKSIRDGIHSSKEIECRELLKRMLRKVKRT